MHASGSSQKIIGGYLILYMDERDQEMYNLIFKAYTLVLLKYKDTVQQIKRKLKFLSDKRGRNHVGYFFSRLRPPDRPGDKCTRKFPTLKSIEHIKLEEELGRTKASTSPQFVMNSTRATACKFHAPPRAF